MKKWFSRVAAALVVTMAVTGTSSTPASAAEPLEVARGLCAAYDSGSFSYIYVTSAGLDPAGAGSARVYLFYSNGSGQNCVVTRKYNEYDKRQLIMAGLRVKGGSWDTDGPGSWLEYAGPVYEYARGTCVNYKGSYNNGNATASFTSGDVGCD